jgi:hypothetical protein
MLSRQDWSRLRLFSRIVALSTEDISPPVGAAETIAGPCRTLPKVDVRIMMTEKEVMCSLPAIDGKTDYASFMGKDPKFHKWYTDLYLHYWEKTIPAVV